MQAEPIRGLQALQARLAQPGPARRLIGIAGPPAGGKSTLAAALQAAVAHSVVVPMDGFHLDNVVLDERGLRAVKGAPETFDVAGFAALLARIAADDGPVHVPLFDRAADLSRNAAATVLPAHRTVIVEGNYLLLDEPGWRELAARFDTTIAIECDEAELERRLVARWREHGLSAAAAKARAMQNDLPNGRRVIGHAIAPDIRYSA